MSTTQIAPRREDKAMQGELYISFELGDLRQACLRRSSTHVRCHSAPPSKVRHWPNCATRPAAPSPAALTAPRADVLQPSARQREGDRRPSRERNPQEFYSGNTFAT